MSEAGAVRAPRAPRDLVPLALAALGLAQAAWVGLSLRVPDLNLGYPFPGGDGHDWIANALALSGEPVRFTGRPPLFPLLLAALERLGAASLLPALQQLVLAALALTGYFALRRSRGRLTAALVALYLLANATLLRQALEIMADPLAAVLLAGACVAFVAARDRPRLYLAAGLLGGLAALTQQAALLVLPAAAVTVALLRRDHLRGREPWIGAALLMALVGAWLGLKAAWLGTAGDHLVRNWSLVHPHLGFVGFYAHAALAFFGWPALALIAAGVARAGARQVRRARGSGEGLPHSHRLADALPFTGLLLAGTLLFFVFFYQWPARRFLIYTLVPSVWWLGEGLAALRPVALRALAGGAAILFAALPPPAGRSADTAWLLWPLPPILVEGPAPRLPAGSGSRASTPFAGEPAPGPERRWFRAPLGAVLAAHPWAEVARFTGWERRFEPIDPRLLAVGGSVVYLEQPGAAFEDRYRTLYRLGNALRSRVKVAPAALYPRDWWGWACLEAGIEADEYALFRWQCAGAPAQVVLALSRHHPRAHPLLELAAGERGLRPPMPAAVAGAWERARRLDAEVRRPDGFLVAFLARGPEAEWLRALPFVARTSSLFIVPGAESATVRSELEKGRALAVWEVAGCALRQVSYLGYEVTVVVACEPE